MSTPNVTGFKGNFPLASNLTHFSPCNISNYFAAGNTNQRVNVTFPAGTQNARPLRVDHGSRGSFCQGQANYSLYGEDPSFIWIVEPPYNVSGVVGGGMSFEPNATREIQPLGRPGDMVIFVTMASPDYQYDRETVGAPYWTSPMYIIGNDSSSFKTATGAASKTSFKAGLAAIVLAVPCLMALL